jgi:hypothetical protein
MFIALGLLFLILVFLLAAMAVPFLRTWIIAGFAIALLVGAGNWLNDWLGIKRKAQEFTIPDRSRLEDEGIEESA